MRRQWVGPETLPLYSSISVVLIVVVELVTNYDSKNNEGTFFSVLYLLLLLPHGEAVFDEAAACLLRTTTITLYNYLY